MSRRPSRIPGTPARRVLMLLAPIPDDAPVELKNALGLRNRCATEGRCPSCGAIPEITWDGNGIGHLTFRHDDDCPVLTDEAA